MIGTRPKIAVICAYNPRNSGMYSVDLAAQHYFSDKDCQVDFFVTQIKRNPFGRAIIGCGLRALLPPHKQFGKMRFRLLENIEQLYAYTHLVYWGDFTTNPVYGATEYATRDTMVRFGRPSASNQEAWKKWKSLFALDTGKPVERVVSAGQNFQNDFGCSSSEFTSVFESIGAHFDHIITRDPHSLDNLSRYLPESSSCKLELGLDCAFLLPPEGDHNPISQFCFQFGRSGFEKVNELVGSIEEQTGFRGLELENWFCLGSKEAGDSFAKMRAQIARSKFVLTDVYHVSVNALALGVPVYTLGRHIEDQIGSLGDFKKKVLFDMMHARSRYFECGEDEDEAEFLERVGAAIEKATALHPDAESALRETINRRTNAFRSTLDEAIFG